MYSKYADRDEAIVVISGDQARIVVGMPVRVIAADGLNEDDLMAIHNMDGVTIKSEKYMPAFEAAFVLRLLSWSQPVTRDELHEYVARHFGGSTAAKTKALEYFDYLEQDRKPDQLILDQAIDGLINCYVHFERWADQQPDGTITLTKGGRMIREAKFGTEPIKQID